MIFSIIIPICNAGDYLLECVKSAVSQDISFAAPKEVKDVYEVLLVENGSTDDSPMICDELATKYPQVNCIHEGKIGLYAARQVGFSKAQGEYLISLDADDALLPCALKELYLAITDCQNNNENVELFIYDAADMRHPDKALSERIFTPGYAYAADEKKIFVEQLCRDDSINSMWIKCVKKTIACLGKQEMFLNYGEDLYQTAEYLNRAAAVMYIDKILYLYRTDASSMSTTYSETYLENEKITWKKLDEIAEKWCKDEFTDLIDERKALTCTIAVARLIYSDLKQKEKKIKLDKLFEDEFYKKYGKVSLPSWAQEEPRFVKVLQDSADPRSALLNNALKNRVKRIVKGWIRNGH